MILDTIITIPSKYPNSYLFHLLTLDPPEFRVLMKASSMKDVVYKVAQDAYGFAI